MKLNKAHKKIIEYLRMNPKATSREIADSLYPTMKGGETHISNILTKMEELRLITRDNRLLD